MNIISTNLSFGSLSALNSVTRIILHHAEARTCSAEDIHRWHKQNGWSGAGYHFLVRKDGSVYRLRPENKVGAHAKGANSNSLGICFEGSYQTETMPEAQVKAGQELVAYLKKKYGISKVQRHSDVCKTSCPGKNFQFERIAYGGQAVIDATPSNWVGRLQQACNEQGFSTQKVDGLPGPITLKGCPTLYKGSTGAITKLAQEKLESLGYSCGSCGADGINGNGTQKAVKLFQEEHGLKVDGIIGENSWRALIYA